MIGLVTTLSTQGTTAAQAVDSQIELKASTEYLINTLNIVDMKVYSTNDSDIEYKLNRNEDRSPSFHLRVNETNAAIQTLADVAASSNMVPLDVFLNEHSENVMSYYEAAVATSSAVTKYYSVDEIVWVEENNDATMCLMYVQVGGQNLEKIFVDSNLAQVYDMVTTGTTTTSS
jgi:hypothetical protein